MRTPISRPTIFGVLAIAALSFSCGKKADEPPVGPAGPPVVAGPGPHISTPSLPPVVTLPPTPNPEPAPNPNPAPNPYPNPVPNPQPSPFITADIRVTRFQVTESRYSSGDSTVSATFDIRGREERIFGNQREFIYRMEDGPVLESPRSYDCWIESNSRFSRAFSLVLSRNGLSRLSLKLSGSDCSNMLRQLNVYNLPFVLSVMGDPMNANTYDYSRDREADPSVPDYYGGGTTQYDPRRSVGYYFFNFRPFWRNFVHLGPEQGCFGKDRRFGRPNIRLIME